MAISVYFQYMSPLRGLILNLSEELSYINFTYIIIGHAPARL